MDNLRAHMDELKQWADDLRQRADQTERELAETRLHGSAGDKAVEVTVTGHGKVVAVEIFPGFLAGSSDQEISRLILAAVTDARSRVPTVIEEKLADLGVDGKALNELLPNGIGETGRLL